VYTGKYSMKLNRITRKQGNKVTRGRVGCNSKRSWKETEDMSAVYIYIADDSSLLRFRKRQVHRINWILLALNSHMLALVSKYATDTRIRGWFKPTYLELNKTHLKNSRH
jgi:hypothetical protein